MALTNSQPFIWRPRGIVDAIDGTNSFEGAMASLANFVPDPHTEGVWVARPPATVLTTFPGFNNPGFVSALLVIGVRAYGMIATSTNAGHDEPFCYDILTNSFISISGVTSANTPTSPAMTGDWVPPIMAQCGSRIIVTHPGFPGGQTKFGWFDVSGFNQTVVGDIVSGSAIITGNPNILGVQPGLAISGTAIPGGTTVMFATNSWTGISFTGTSHSSFLIDGIASTAGFLTGFILAGPGVPPNCVVASVGANSITVTEALTSSTTSTFYLYGMPSSLYQGTLTVGSNNIAASNTTGIWVGQQISGIGIPAGSTVIGVTAGVQVNISQNATIGGLQNFTVTGTIIVMSADATGTHDAENITIAGGSFAAPQWGAGDTQPNNLVSTPVGVAQMTARAWYACGTDGIVFSDSGFPCQVSNATAVQALTTGDGLAVTAIGPTTLASLVGGQVQSLIAFEGPYKMQQITGDPTTNNLAMNALPVATGSEAPLSLTPMKHGLSFISPQGLRVVDFTGRVSDPWGDHGMGITAPFIYAVQPSRICSASTADTIRITTQNGNKDNDPYEEYCVDLTRTTAGRQQAWYGPHSSTASLIEPYGDQFVMTFVGITGRLYLSSITPQPPSSWLENGEPIVCMYMPVMLMPDTGDMRMKAIVKTHIACGGPSCSPVAPPEALTYTPPIIGQQPNGPPGVLPPNIPPPPPVNPCLSIGELIPGAITFYSTSRSLSQSNCNATQIVRLRRASDAAELDIGVINGIIDTATAAAFCSGTTCTIAKIYNQGTDSSIGGGLGHWSHTFPGQPTWNTTDLFYPTCKVIQTGGTQIGLGASATVLSTAFTVGYVMQLNQITDGSCMVYSGFTSFEMNYGFGPPAPPVTRGGSQFGMNNSGAGNQVFYGAASSTGNFVNMAVCAFDATSAMYVNGATISGAGDAGGNAMAGTWVLNPGGPGLSPWDVGGFDISEFVVWPYRLSAAQISAYTENAQAFYRF